MNQTGPHLFSRNFLNYIAHAHHDKVIAFSPIYFYPIPNTVRGIDKRSIKEKWIRSESMAVHYWECAWIK